MASCTPAKGGLFHRLARPAEPCRLTVSARPPSPSAPVAGQARSRAPRRPRRRLRGAGPAGRLQGGRQGRHRRRPRPDHPLRRGAASNYIFLPCGRPAADIAISKRCPRRASRRQRLSPPHPHRPHVGGPGRPRAPPRGRDQARPHLHDGVPRHDGAGARHHLPGLDDARRRGAASVCNAFMRFREHLAVSGRSGAGAAEMRVRRRHKNAGDQAGSAHATGFVVDFERGIILTNRHVIGTGPVLPPRAPDRAAAFLPAPDLADPSAAGDLFGGVSPVAPASSPAPDLAAPSAPAAPENGTHGATPCSNSPKRSNPA